MKTSSEGNITEMDSSATKPSAAASEMQQRSTTPNTVAEQEQRNRSLSQSAERHQPQSAETQERDASPVPRSKQQQPQPHRTSAGGTLRAEQPHKVSTTSAKQHLPFPPRETHKKQVSRTHVESTASLTASEAVGKAAVGTPAAADLKEEPAAAEFNSIMPAQRGFSSKSSQAAVSGGKPASALGKPATAATVRHEQHGNSKIVKQRNADKALIETAMTEYAAGLKTANQRPHIHSKGAASGAYLMPLRKKVSAASAARRVRLFGSGVHWLSSSDTLGGEHNNSALTECENEPAAGIARKGDELQLQQQEEKELLTSSRGKRLSAKLSNDSSAVAAALLSSTDVEKPQHRPAIQSMSSFIDQDQLSRAFAQTLSVVNPLTGQLQIMAKRKPGYAAAVINTRDFDAYTSLQVPRLYAPLKQKDSLQSSSMGLMPILGAEIVRSSGLRHFDPVYSRDHFSCTSVGSMGRLDLTEGRACDDGRKPQNNRPYYAWASSTSSPYAVWTSNQAQQQQVRQHRSKEEVQRKQQQQQQDAENHRAIELDGCPQVQQSQDRVTDPRLHTWKHQHLWHQQQPQQQMQRQAQRL